MSQRHIKAAFAKIDPAHLFDGLFVPTSGKKRERLFAQRDHGGKVITFQGFEQLGGDDQSILLAICAQLGIDGLQIEADPQGPISKQLRLDLQITGNDANFPVATKKTSLRSLLVDAGYKDPEDTRNLKRARDCLNRLANAQIREQDPATGWDRRANLISTSFNKDTGETHIAANPRLTGAVFAGQNVQVSLHERAALSSEVGKILHSWLCSNIRLGGSLGYGGQGAKLETLAAHVWGPSHADAASYVKSKRKSQIREALEELADVTRDTGNRWAIEVHPSGIATVSRPKELPFFEGAGLTPSDVAALAACA